MLRTTQKGADQSVKLADVTHPVTIAQTLALDMRGPTLQADPKWEN